MPQSTFRTCFIAAPFGTDTAVLRELLDQRNIRWRDQTKIEAGTSWLDVLDTEISRADFVCMVLPGQRQGNLLFELGVAYAKRKPILAFVSSPLAIPTDIRSLTYFRSDPTDRQAVAAALGTFLEHATPTKARRIRLTAVKTKQPRTIPERITVSNAREAEQRTADLLRQSGFIVSGEDDIVSGEDDKISRGADFAVWIDDLEQSLGGLLLVDVKTGTLSAGSLRNAASQLRSYVEKTHGRSGLLVYWDRQNREFARITSEWPVIFQLSGPALIDLVARGELAKELVRLRNAAIHGKV